jgi:tetratricopeptide (TPR) repeat protein
MLARLQSRLKLLTGGGRDLPARQQTLRGAIEWSYDLLEEGEKQLFRRLAVFVGGCTLAAIEAVCNAEGDLEVDMLDGVQSLVDKSLLRQEEGVVGEPRFVMLETIHEYAREKLQESGEAEVLRRHHAEYFLALAEAAEQQLSGTKLSEWLDRLEEELDNFRAALAWLLERAKEPAGKELRGANTEAEKALRLSAAFREFWHGRHYEEGRRWLEEALATSSAAGSSVRPTTHRAKALSSAGLLAIRQADVERASALFEEMLLIARELGDRHGVAEALKWLGNLSLNDEEGLTFQHESLALYRELGDKEGISRVLNNMGARAQLQGEYDQAIALYEESLRLRREMGTEAGTDVVAGITTTTLGFALYHRGDYARARTVFTEALTLWRELAIPHGCADALMGLAGVAQARQEPARAARLLAAALLMLETTGGAFDTVERQAYERIVESTRAQLDEQTWQKAWEEGRAMSVEQAVEYALADSEEPSDA